MSCEVNGPVPPGFSTGLKPRNYKTHPVGCYAFAPPFPEDALIPESDWPARLAAQQANKSSLLDLRNSNYDTLKSLDQDGLGLCWAFSSTKAVMYVRAINNLPPIRLSAWFVAGCVKGWQDEGGWGAESLGFIVENGAPAESFCPSYKRSYDNAETRANAAMHKCTEWWDGGDGRDKMRKQLVTCLLLGIPCVVDLDWMGHSMCCIAVESLDPLRVVFDNSWGDQGDKGLYRAEGSKAIPDALIIPRVVRASVV